MHKLFKYFTQISLLMIIIIISSNLFVAYQAKYTYKSVEIIPHKNVGLLLGTIKTLSNGNTNWYYKYRIDAAVNLFNAQKIDYILVSGDNSRENYDEPSDMKEDLIAAGIPEKKIFLDYAGFRTLDSVIRAKEIFGQAELTIISQQFHNERAIAIAKSKGMDAIGFNAKGISAKYGWKVKIREIGARTKMVFDLIFGIQPKFLGEKIEIS